MKMHSITPGSIYNGKVLPYIVPGSKSIYDSQPDRLRLGNDDGKVIEVWDSESNPVQKTHAGNLTVWVQGQLEKKKNKKLHFCADTKQEAVDRIMLRVNTVDEISSGYKTGQWEVFAGKPRCIMAGTHKNHHGHIQGKDGLLLMQPGDAISFRSNGLIEKEVVVAYLGEGKFEIIK